jgi:ADP-heptose:LPS heptosyltransferase
MPAFDRERRDTVLIVRPGSLGDAVLTLPVLSAVSGRGPVAVLGNPGAWGFLRPGRVRVLDIDARDWRGLFADSEVDGDAMATLTRVRHAVVYLGSQRLAVEARFARLGIPHVTGVTPLRPGELGDGHAAERLLRPVAHGLGADLALHLMPKRLPDDDLICVASRPDSGKNVRPHVVVHPGSGGAEKRWPPTAFVQLVRRLVRRAGVDVVLLGGPADTATIAEIDAGLSDTPHRWLIDRPLPEIMGWMIDAWLYVGNDSGLGHLAARACPTLVLFGPTEPSVWRPLGTNVSVLRAPRGDLADLSVDDVWAHVAGLLTAEVPAIAEE